MSEPILRKLPEELKPLRFIFRQTKKEATRRSIPFELSWSELLRMHERARGRCELTGVKFSGESWGTYRRPWLMSIDRIDSREGYRFENCRLVTVAANVATSDWGEGVLLTMLKSMMDDHYDIDTHAEEQVR